MFILSWYRKIHTSTVNRLLDRKLTQRKKLLIKQRKKALEEIQYIGRFSYWPTAKITTKAPVTNLLDRKRMNKIAMPPRPVTLRYHASRETEPSKLRL
ncbi:hypothetical protein KO495_03720 [Colwellia sp. D2M02]|uniref:hypothetical protein n=1 Tax=Colwellia sp. D2M02 TaxID=2841562 RepID=UPI001C095026|nr:hypothetical protein [Colwellia sp. D2M02]MBU2892431.1 hypothetical protein [Colwellia sp. D2M02]